MNATYLFPKVAIPVRMLISVFVYVTCLLLCLDKIDVPLLWWHHPHRDATTILHVYTICLLWDKRVLSTYSVSLLSIYDWTNEISRMVNSSYKGSYIDYLPLTILHGKVMLSRAMSICLMFVKPVLSRDQRTHVIVVPLMIYTIFQPCCTGFYTFVKILRQKDHKQNVFNDDLFLVSVKTYEIFNSF